MLSEEPSTRKLDARGMPYPSAGEPRHGIVSLLSPSLQAGDACVMVVLSAAAPRGDPAKLSMQGGLHFSVFEWQTSAIVNVVTLIDVAVTVNTPGTSRRMANIFRFTYRPCKAI